VVGKDVNNSISARSFAQDCNFSHALGDCMSQQESALIGPLEEQMCALFQEHENTRFRPHRFRRLDSHFDGGFLER
jgi:hypothetical protein